MSRNDELQLLGRIAVLEHAIIRLFRLRSDGRAEFQSLTEDHDRALLELGLTPGQDHMQIGATYESVFIREALEGPDQFAAYRRGLESERTTT